LKRQDKKAAQESNKLKMKQYHARAKEGVLSVVEATD
jgi:hypothetical protein